MRKSSRSYGENAEFYCAKCDDLCLCGEFVEEDEFLLEEAVLIICQTIRTVNGKGQN